MMSTSLDKDLHSVYIDGEMPENFAAQYEDLISKNEKEKQELQKMKAIHDFLQEDSRAKTVSQDFAEESFVRLQTKMRYAQNIGYAGEQKSVILPFVKYASSFAAAAAVFAVIFLPTHYNSIKETKETEIAAISIMKDSGIEPLASRDVMVDGNLKPENINLKAESSENTTSSTATASKAIAKNDTKKESEASPQAEQKTVYASALASNGGNTGYANHLRNQFRKRLPAVDPFVPNFSSSITISIPNFHEMSHNDLGNTNIDTFGNIEPMDFPDEPKE